MRVIMDVDTGIDDAVALALAVKHPNIDLEAVIAVAGNVSLEQTTRNTLCVLDWLGATHVPVAQGSATGLSGPFEDASLWHGPDGLGQAQLPRSQRAALSNGVDYLIERVRAAPGELTLICTAPLTNIACALEREPHLPSLVKEVVLMGGAARPPGNVTAVAEFNIHADAVAAARVFEQDWPVTMVGLDVTSRVPLTRQDRTALQAQNAREATLLCEVTRWIFETRGLDRFLLHDALAVAVAVDPSLVTLLEREVRVETRGEHTFGQTVVDFRARVQGGREAGQTRVCVDVDVERFRALLFGTLGVSI